MRLVDEAVVYQMNRRPTGYFERTGDHQRDALPMRKRFSGYGFSPKTQILLTKWRKAAIFLMAASGVIRLMG